MKRLFKNVTEEHARIEGEDDKTLKYWQRAHRKNLKYDCDCIGKTFSDEVPVVFE